MTKFSHSSLGYGEGLRQGELDLLGGMYEKDGFLKKVYQMDEHTLQGRDHINISQWSEMPKICARKVGSAGMPVGSIFVFVFLGGSLLHVE